MHYIIFVCMLSMQVYGTHVPGPEIVGGLLCLGGLLVFLNETGAFQIYRVPDRCRGDQPLGCPAAGGPCTLQCHLLHMCLQDNMCHLQGLPPPIKKIYVQNN